MFKKALFILMALLLIAPFAWAGERVVTVGGNSPTRPITDFGINLTTAYYVDSVNGDDGRRGLSPATAVATLDYAISLTTINQGDIIYLMPNSDEEISGAGTVTMDMAGVRVIGLGSGADRPTFTFSDTASTILFTAASTSIENVILVPSVDSVVSAIVVSAANVSLGVEVRDASATVEFVTAVLTTAAADNLTINMKYRGYIAGNACVAPIQLVGVDTARIYVDYYGEASTAVVNFITTACLDIQISGLFWNDNVALTKNVIDTEGNGEWFVQGWDGKGGYFFTGSDAIALAAGGNTTVDAILVDTGTTIPATITTAQNDLDTLTGASGANLLTATQASIDAIEASAEKAVSGSTAVMVNGDTIFTIAGGPIQVLSLVSVCITSNDGTGSTLQYSATCTVGGAATFSNPTATLANFAAGGGSVLNMTNLATAPDLTTTALVALDTDVSNKIIINAGIITVVIATGSTTGTWKHYLRYRPLDPGVTVTGT